MIYPINKGHTHNLFIIHFKNWILIDQAPIGDHARPKDIKSLVNR